MGFGLILKRWLDLWVDLDQERLGGDISTVKSLTPFLIHSLFISGSNLPFH